MTSPAERFAASRRRARHGDLAEFTAELSFPLDPFQQEACEAVADGHSVLVAAPTGAGKTLVGEYAVRHAYRRGEKSFYTTPIKALSNQKFHDLSRAYGPGNVGLLTGDTSINPDADIVVMTTEVLRNMIYAGSSTLDRLGVVVLDEVHYLADRYRGSVWEEVIIHLHERTAIIALSATVSNAEEFGAWLREVRGDTRVIVSEHRPVPLWPHVLLREGIYDLYAPGVDPQDPGPTPRLNPELEAVAKRARHEDARAPGGRGRPTRGGRRPQGRRAPPRFAVVDVLDRQGLLPAIVFIFSRAACEDAVEQVRHAGMVLTTEAERHEIARIVEERCAGLPPEDLGALGYTRWRDSLEAGVAAHHAGMIPLFKEVVEELFAGGLIKVVYATETLALGINMPARSVVLEKLVKWDGQGHKDLTAGEYTQLTGRAGRRGIDVEGHAVVVEHPGFDAPQLGRLASRRTYPLISSFQPTYNMAINLVATLGVAHAREVLEMSFAQYQADQSVVGKARRVKEIESTLAGYAEAAACDRGDFMEYAALRERLNRQQKQASRVASRARKEASAATLAALVRGDVVKVGGGRRAGLVAVVDPDDNPVAPRPLVVTDQGRVHRLAISELHHGLEQVGTVRIPRRFDARNARSRRELAQLLHDNRHSYAAARRRRGDDAEERASQDQELETRRLLREHPCHQCPDREAHARWAERYHRALRDKDKVVGEIQRATGSISQVFDKRLEILTALGYVEPAGDAMDLTRWGEMMRRIYSENDIVIAEALRTGAWDRLNAAALAAAVSAVLYEGRREDETRAPRVPGGPHGVLGTALRETVRLWSAVDDMQKERHLPGLSAPHWGLVGPVHGWAQGKGLDAVLHDTEIAPGDMVRWCKQVIDVLDQIHDVAPSAALRDTAASAIRAIRRGVVAY
ncbi:DEAD/DEAH box helicase [Demequina sp. SYSU T00039]|uniref:DEAD/DEAH box helicase n=1 Tax=Demequina lignilytica TaxID=3051663 RepID=A0AAW7M0K1_9MICO|nr:DEAD/DEAH box helicase [Demequina sp. SYSU T00039]MDN4486669.1 DEAD/DEAH box helicase [Demequina sp. SYSU T00039]